MSSHYLEGRKIDVPVILPAHPRTRKMIEQINEEEQSRTIVCVEPIGYLKCCILQRMVKVVTDSGGL